MLPFLLLLALQLVPAGALGQEPSLHDAGLPRPGELWLEFLPSIESWGEVFAADRPDDGVAAGERVPLHRDLAGPLASRLFPGASPLAADLNLDAEALGFDPVSAEELSFGALEFGSLHAQRRRAELGLELGLVTRVSVELRAPLVFTDVEAHFAFDPTGVTVLPGSAALEDPVGLFEGFAAARSELEARVAAGELSPEEEAMAVALLEDSGVFLEALQRRAVQNRLLPLAGTPAGLQLSARYGSLEQGFAGFDLVVPDLSLRDAAAPEDVAAFFSLPPLSGELPTRVRHGWTVPEIEAGLRFSLWDGFSTGRGVGPLRLRTALGARFRLPIGSPDEPPFHDLDAFLQAPVGDAGRDVELAGYQDVALGTTLLLNASVRYGLRLADDVTRRVHPPDRPFAFAETRTALRRDRGDYLLVRLVPQLRLTEIVSVGLEYDFAHLGSDRFRVLGADPGAADASLLELETGGTLHRLGFGVSYRTGRAAAPSGSSDGEPRRSSENRGRPGSASRESAAAGAPWRLAFVLQGALAGSGGRTPAPQRVMAALRAPIRLF